MRFRLARVWATIALVILVGCALSSPTTGPPTATSAPPTAALLPPTGTPTDTPVPPTDTPTLTATATPIPPTPTPSPATDTVCAAGCDFTTIQAAIDDAASGHGAIIEVRDPIHTEAGIVVSRDVTIRGLGAGSTVVQAHETLDGAQDRVFVIQPDTKVALEKMTIQHGKPSEDNCGGGILSEGGLTLRHLVVRTNMANGGGGVCSRGREAALTVIDSTIRDNIAGATVAGSLACGNGGGIRSGSGALKLINSTVAGNSTATGRGRGGGIHIGCGGTAVFTNTTISGNRASPRSDNAVSRNRRGHGGGVNLHGALRLVNCTISDNRAIGPGGGLYVRGHLDFVNTIVANNASGSGNCVVSGPDAYGISGSLGTNSLNLVADGTCDPDFSGDPMLSHLDDNGGNTLTQALLPGSPAIDAIPVVSCTLPTDQRGGLRPVVQVSPETPCDIGAFEVQPEESSETSPESSPSGTGWSQMVLVPAGESVMGSDEGRGDEGPVHRVTLDAFYIDRMEVTNAQFAHFLNERGNKEEGGETWLDDDDEDCLIKRRGSHFQPKAGYEDHPVIEVTWYGARAYCAWRGQEVGEPLRLPTEAEWEKAASWDPTTGVKQVYPWGDRWDRGVVNADWPITDTTELGPHTSPVTDHVEGASRSGALNMGGNVWEWVSDWYASDYYAYSPSQNPQVPDAGEDKVLRGGSWRSPREFVRTTVRHHWFPDYTFDIGFRCARSAEDAVGP